MAKYGGFAVTIARNVQYPEVRNDLLDFIKTAGNCEGLVIYFAGHGEVRKGELFLVVDNTNAEEFLETSLRCEEITLHLKFCNAKNKLLILDCCNAGAGAKDIRAAGGVPVSEIVQSESFRVFAASEMFEPTREHERWGGSFLSSVLVDQLTQRSMQSVSDVEAECRLRAEEHRTRFPGEWVSFPFVYGQESGRFLLSLPRLKNFPKKNQRITSEFWILIVRTCKGS